MRNQTLNLGLRLLIITLVAGAALGLTQSVTEPARIEVERKAMQESLEAVYPGATFTEMSEEAVAACGIAEVNKAYVAKEKDQEGLVVDVSTKGSQGLVQVYVGLDAEGQVVGLTIGENSETPGIGDKAANPEFLDQFLNKAAAVQLVKSTSGKEDEIAGVTGATYTSRAVVNAVNLAGQFQTAMEGGQ